MNCTIDSFCIAEVDTVIKRLSPLISPLKIYRVSEGGNFIIHMNLDNTPVGRGIGYALVNNLNLFSVPINYADVYTTKYALHYLSHEMCHAIGLSHPQKQYPFYNIMGNNEFYVKEYIDENADIANKPLKNALVFDTEAEMLEFESRQNRMKISIEEQKVIKMLYSNDFKPRLTRYTFLRKMGLTITKSKDGK